MYDMRTLALLCSALVIMARGGASAQSSSSTPALIGNGLGANSVQSLFGLTGAAPKSTLDAPGVTCYELLHGNGSRSGYILSHGAVLPDTLSIYVDGTRLKAGQDYWLDAGGGNIYLASPVMRGDVLSVNYRYLDGAAAQAASATMPGLQFNLAPNTRLGLMFGMAAGNGSGYSTSLNGFSLSSAFGSHHLSRYSGLAYFSNVQADTNRLMNIDPTLNAATAGRPDVGNDHLIVQNLGLQSGAFQLNADFQDVGKKFGGFAALRSANSGDKATLDQLTQIEGEKGVQRLGFGLNWNGSPSVAGKADAGATSGLGLRWNDIRDGTSDILQRGADLTSGALDLHYTALNIGQTFSRFDGLHDADKAQWAREKGLSVSTLGFGLRFGAGKRAETAGGINFRQLQFSDKSGALRSDLWTLKTGTLGLSMFRRSASLGFSRLGDLSDADKASLVLDVYHLYDASADAKQVTADDLGQLTREAGIARSAENLSLALGKQGGLNVSHLKIGDAPAAVAAGSATSASAAPAATQRAAGHGLSREAVSLREGALNLDLTTRRTDTDFSALANLPDVDKRFLALDIQRQFDPAAQIDKVTPAQRDQAAADEHGLSRSLLKGSLALGRGARGAKLSFSQIALTDLSLTDGSAGTLPGGHPGLQRQTFGFDSPRLQISLLRQSIADEFSRLTSMTDIEHAQYGNEHGLWRQQWSLSWQIAKDARLGLNGLSLGATDDALLNAQTLAVKNGIDAVAAERAAIQSLQRRGFTLGLKGLSLVANESDTGKGFTRAADLATTDADRQVIEQELGFHRTDETFHFDRIKGLTLDSYAYDAQDSLDKLFHQTFRHSIAFAPSKKFLFTASSDSDIASTSDQENGSRHDLISAASSLDKTTSFKLSDDHRVTLSAGKQSEVQRQETIHLDSARLGIGGSIDYQVQDARFLDGQYQHEVIYSVNTKPSAKLSFNYNSSEMQRSPDPTNAKEAGKAQIDENTDGYDLQFQASRQFAVTLGNSTTKTDDNNNSDTVSVGMKGEPFKNVTLAAKFGEVHSVAAQNTKDVADVAIGNSKPVKLGLLHDLTVKAGYVSLNDKRKLQNEAMTGHAQWTLWKNAFLLDYNGLTQPDGKSTTSRLYQFTTDPNPKLRFHGSFLYKDRTLVDGTEKLIRRFTADDQLAKRTQFVYTYGTLPEDDQGNIKPEMSEDVSLKHQLAASLTGIVFYRVNDNMSTKLLTRGLGFGVEGQMGPRTKLTLSWSKDTNGFADRYDRSDHIRCSFDQHINADDYFSLTAELRTHDGKGANGVLLDDEMSAHLDLNFRF